MHDMRLPYLDFSMRPARLPLRWLLAGAAALAACGVAGAQPVLQMDGMAASGGAAAGQSQPAHIRSLVQTASQRVPPRLIALPELTGAKAAPVQPPQFGQPLQIGVARAVPQAADAAATASLLNWTRGSDGSQRAAIGVLSPGAKGLRLGLRVEQLPPLARLRVYAPDDAQTTEIDAAQVLRALQNNRAAGETGEDAITYWLPLVQGSEAALEIELPAGADPAQLKVALARVTHAKVLPADAQAMAKDGAAACNVDVMCVSGVSDIMHAVAVMDFIANGGEWACTGTLVTNAKKDFTPYFLSANHCISTQSAASSLMTFWNYRSSSCNGLQRDPAFTYLTGGAQLLYATDKTDTSFMRLNDTPPANAFFAGWNAQTPGSANLSIFGIHHPSEDWQKYSQGATTGFRTCGAPDADGVIQCNESDLANGTFYRVLWSKGITEGGSSGSALLTTSGQQIVGQLLGGSSSCQNPKGLDVYGRFDLAYSAALSKWLDPDSGSQPQPPAGSATDGIYLIAGTSGAPDEYLSVHTNGGKVLATVYRSADPVNAGAFTLTDGGKNVATLYKWGSWDLYNGTLSGNTATLASGYLNYGLCNATGTITFGASPTILIASAGPSGFAPPGAQCGGQTLRSMQRITTTPANAAYDGVYLVTDSSGGAGDYISMHTDTASNAVYVTAYRGASPASASFQLTDGGTQTATLYMWGSWDLYSGTLSGSAATLTSGYLNYGQCNATGSIAFNANGGAIRLAPNGASPFAPASAASACNASSGSWPTLNMVRQF
jgi:hypothetical protein